MVGAETHRPPEIPLNGMNLKRRCTYDERPFIAGSPGDFVFTAQRERI